MVSVTITTIPHTSPTHRPSHLTLMAPIMQQSHSSFKLLTTCTLNVGSLIFSLLLWSFHGMFGAGHSLTMLLTWTIRTLATNCARLYNTCIRKDKDVPYDYPIASKMTVKHMWDAFTLLAILKDCEHQATLLIVPHSGNQSVCFRAAMQARNRRVQANGYCQDRFNSEGEL